MLPAANPPHRLEARPDALELGTDDVAQCGDGPFDRLADVAGKLREHVDRQPAGDVCANERLERGLVVGGLGAHGCGYARDDRGLKPRVPASMLLVGAAGRDVREAGVIVEEHESFTIACKNQGD